MSGDLVVAAVRDAFDDLVGAEPAQVVADLAAGHVPGIFSQLGGEEKPQVAAGEAGGRSASAEQAARSAWTRGSGKRMPGTRVQVVLMTGLVRVSRAAVPAAGSWLMHSASRRRRLAV